MSVLRYSYNSLYFNTANVWKAEDLDSDYATGISEVGIFNSNEATLLKLKAPLNSDLQSISYYGNINTALVTNSAIAGQSGYPILASVHKDNMHRLFTNKYLVMSKSDNIDPISMKYKSTPHAVVVLNYANHNNEIFQRILPTLKDGIVSSETSVATKTWRIDDVDDDFGTNKLYWEKEKKTKGVSQDVVNYSFYSVNDSYDGLGPEYGYLWIGELYQDDFDITTRFGGRTATAFENNQWLPCGKAVAFKNDFGDNKESVTIEYSEGDTYYQRYDHLKTYPFTLEDQNSIVDIISFMCETRVNLDGRYDRNRGQYSNLVMTPVNFNLMNEVYSQSNNFFNYRGLDTTKLHLDNFYSTITWTKTKTAGELIDTWTNLTLASTLDLDGDKGHLTSLNKLNNEIIAFQERGISNILFNSRTQLSVEKGLPVEIANSGKVDGKVYVSNNIGCYNKWSTCETSSGIYFIDSINKGIYLFNGQLKNLSDTLGFHSWINSKLDSLDIWDPGIFNDFVTYYDTINKDVLFISKDECLAFSETLGQFSSFYSYEKTPYFINIDDKGVFINKEKNGSTFKLWIQHKGDYNKYFNSFEPFYTTLVSNDSMITDKIFNNLEFRADTWNEDNVLLNTTFDKLYTWNEYQSGEADLVFTKGYPSTLKRKFRTWGVNIPRDSINKRDRMRNPWLYIKLAMETENTNKTTLHDVVVDYFE